MTQANKIIFSIMTSFIPGLNVDLQMYVWILGSQRKINRMNKVLPSDHGDDSTHGSTGFNLQGLTGKGKIGVGPTERNGTITCQE